MPFLRWFLLVCGLLSLFPRLALSATCTIQDNTFAVIQDVVKITSTGTQDYTCAGFGTATGALFFAERATAIDTSTTGAGFMVGAFDGTREWTLNIVSRFGQATSVTEKHSASTCVHSQIVSTPTSTEYEGNCTFITDGVRINYTTVGSSAYLLFIVLMKPAHFYVGDASTSSTTPLAVTAPGFQPTDVFLAANRQSAALPVFATQTMLALGFVHAGGNSGSVGIFGNNGGTPDNRGCTRTDRALVTSSATATCDTNLIVDTFGASGFTITASDADAIRWHYAAMDWTGRSSWVGAITSPVATGSQAYTGPGFKPGLMLAIGSIMDATNTAFTDLKAGHIGWGVAVGNTTWCGSYTDEDAAGTTNTRTRVSDHLHCGRSHSGGNGYTASLTSRDATGWTSDWTDATLTGTYIHMFAVSATPPTRRRTPLWFGN